MRDQEVPDNSVPKLTQSMKEKPKKKRVINQIPCDCTLACQVVKNLKVGDLPMTTFLNCCKCNIAVDIIHELEVSSFKHPSICQKKSAFDLSAHSILPITDPCLEFLTGPLINTTQHFTFRPAFNLITPNHNQHPIIKVYLNSLPVAALLDRESPHNLIHPDIAVKAGISKDNKTILLVRF